MILGVSHLAFRVKNIDESTLFFIRQGWHQAFSDTNILINSEEKKLLSPSHPETQTILMLRHPTGLPAIELVKSETSYPETTLPAAWLAIDNLEPSSFFSCTNNRNTNINSAMQSGKIIADHLLEGYNLFVQTPSLIDIEPIWQVLGFTKEGSAAQKTISHWKIKRPLPSWSLSITLIETSCTNISYPLERQGCFVLSLLSTDIHNDSKKLLNYSTKAIHPFQTTINKKKWLLALFVIPGGFTIELMAPGE